jgi:hypothetical protein
MARTSRNDDAQTMTRASAVVTGTVVTMACWHRSFSLSARFACLMSVGDGTTSNTFALFYDGVGNAGLANSAAFYANESATNAAHTSTVIADSEWHHYCGMQDESNLVRVYLDGGGKGSAGVGANPAGMNGTWLGGFINGNGFQIDGSIAEAAMWNEGLTDGEVWQLSRGALPWTIRPRALVAYWLPFQDFALENSGKVLDMNPYRPRKNDLTINGSAYPRDWHPPRVKQFLDPKRRYWYAKAPAAGAFAGDDEGLAYVRRFNW